MKKLFALLLTALIVLSCTACSSDTSGAKDGLSHDHGHTQSYGETTAVAASTNSHEETTAESNRANTEEDSGTSVTKGTVKGNVYRSGFSGLTFTKPDGWNFASDEELATRTDVSAGELKPELFSFTADRVPAVYDMIAVDDATGVEVVIAYENMYVTSDRSMTAEEYLSTIKGAFEETDSTAAPKEFTVTLSGNTYLKAIFETEQSGTAAKKIYYLRRMDNFINFILVTVPDGAETPDIEAMFG